MVMNKAVLEQYNEEISVLRDRLNGYIEFGYTEYLEPIVHIYTKVLREMREAKDNYIKNNLK